MANPKVCILSGDLPTDSWVEELIPSARQAFPKSEKPVEYPFYRAWRLWEKEATGQRLPITSAESDDLLFDFIGPFACYEMPETYVPEESVIAKCIKHSMEVADFIFVYIDPESEDILTYLGYAIAISEKTGAFLCVAYKDADYGWFTVTQADLHMSSVDRPDRTFIECLGGFLRKWEYA